MEDMMLHNGSGMTDKEMADWHYAHRAEMDASIDENESIGLDQGRVRRGCQGSGDCAQKRGATRRGAFPEPRCGTPPNSS